MQVDRSAQRLRAFSDADSPSYIVTQAGTPPNKPLPLPPQPTIMEARAAFARLCETKREDQGSQVLGLHQRKGSLRITTREIQVYKKLIAVPSFEQFERNNFHDLTAEKIPFMSSKERRSFKDKLNEVIFCEHLGVSELRVGASDALLRLEAYEENIKETRLIRSIMEHKEEDLKGLYLANECLIKTAPLFKGIQKAVQRLANDKMSNTKLSMLLIFCREWVHANKGTRLAAIPITELNAIIEATKDHSYVGVRKHSMNLAEAVDLARMSPHGSVVEVERQLKFEKILDKLTSIKEHKDVNRYADMVAEDLCQFNRFHYNLLTGHDFVDSKWEGGKSPLLKQYSAYMNGISDFIIETILDEPDLKKRINLVKFFSKVAIRCLDAGEYSTPFAINMGLGTRCLTRLRKTFESVNNPASDCSKRMQRLQELFMPMDNFKVLRSEMNDRKKIIPYLGLIQKGVTNALEIEPILGKEPEELRYNLGKVDHIRKSVSKPLAWQAEWQKKNGWHEYRHQTDILDVIFKQKLITDEWADRASDQLKAAEAALP